MNNRDRLIALISENKLERSELAAMLKVKLSTVNNWLLPNTSRHHEEVPDMAMELLTIKLGKNK